jgi:hypothetical protein
VWLRLQGGGFTGRTYSSGTRNEVVVIGLEGSGIRVYHIRFERRVEVQGEGLRVQGIGCGVWAARTVVEDSGIWIWGVGYMGL